MNNIIKYSLAAALSIGISNTCLAIVITDTNAGTSDGANVGNIDNFLAEADKVGNPTAEETWVNMILADITDPDVTVSYTTKTEDVAYYLTNGLGSTSTAAGDVFAFDLTPASDYFLVKNSTRMALFENLADLDWGVFDTTLLSSAMNLPTEPYEISHVTRFDDNTPGTGPDEPNVPEPTSLMLLGLGLLGFVGARRKKA